MSSKRIPIARGGEPSIPVEVGATVGATVGVNLRWEDGTLVTREDLAPEPPAEGLSVTYWRMIREIPANVVALAETTATGLYVITGDGASATRAIQPAVGETTVSNGDGVAGNPVVGLADVADSGSGALLAVTRDAKGRVSGTKAATITGTAGQIEVADGDAIAGLPTISLADVTPTPGGTLQRYGFDAKGRRIEEEAADTDDLAEGASNLYYSDVRVDTRVQAASYTIAGTWVFTGDIRVNGITAGRGAGSINSNTAFGVFALSANTTGNNNLAFGFRALNKNTTGTFNTAIGNGSLEDTLTTNNNVAIGTNAMQRSVGAAACTAVGTVSLQNASASNNTAIGAQAGQSNTSGARNTYIGSLAGRTTSSANANVSGSNNTFIGNNSGPGTPTQLSFASTIGSDAIVTTSNTVVLGRTTDNTVLGATGDDGSGAKLQVTGAVKSTTEYRVAANKVVGARDTGWTAVAGTAQKGGGTTYTAPTISNPPTQAEVQAIADALQAAHRTIKALTDALTTHGLIGT